MRTGGFVCMQGKTARLLASIAVFDTRLLRHEHGHFKPGFGNDALFNKSFTERIHTSILDVYSILRYEAYRLSSSRFNVRQM
jgi:hypothetical protein